MFFINILIIDDNVFKSVNIQRALNFRFKNNIETCSNQEDALEKINESIKNRTPYDLIITDMHYPMMKYSDPDDEAGFKLIEKLNKNNINIPIVVCSSVNWNIPEIFGTVWYNELNDIERNFQNILNKLIQRNNDLER